MKTQKINLSFTKYTDAELQAKAEEIYVSMFNNSNFPVTVPTIADFKFIASVYTSALYAAANRSRENVALKNQARTRLETALMQLGLSVMNTASGDVPMLVSSGFTLAKMPTHQNITEPGAVILSDGITSGQLVAAIPSVPGAKSYQYQIATDPVEDNFDWQNVLTTRCKHVFNNLQAGVKYWVRVAAIGNRGQIAYGPASTRFVQ